MNQNNQSTVMKSQVGAWLNIEKNIDKLFAG